LQCTPGRAGVGCRNGDGARKVPVTVGLSNGSVTEIVSGLKEGDQVVLQQ